MNNRKRCYSIINSFTEEQLGIVVTIFDMIRTLTAEPVDNDEFVDMNTFAQDLRVMLRFNQKLKNAMQELNITQAQVVGMTGIGKSSISQYLSGKNTPTEERQRAIAVALGLDPDYFEKDSISAVISKLSVIPRLKPTEAARLMGLDAETIRKGLQQGRFPWGYGILTTPARFVDGLLVSKEHWTYFINANSFANHEGLKKG